MRIDTCYNDCMQQSAFEQQNSRFNFIGFITVIAAISVIFLHVNSCFWEYSNISKAVWISANIIDSIFYFAVPVFYMISGATLLNFYHRYRLRTYLKRRFLKTVIPFLFWSIVALIFRVVVFGIDNINLQNIIYLFLEGKALDIYWFFIPLFSIYLSIPLFAAVSDEKKKTVFSYLVVVGFAINICLPFIFVAANIRTPETIQVLSIFGYMFYVPLGYLLANYSITKKIRILIYFFGLAGLITQLLGTHFLTLNSNELVTTFKGYLNLPAVLYSIAMFVLLKECGNLLSNKNRMNTIILFLARFSFSSYLVHYYFIVLGQYFLKEATNSIAYRLLIPIPIYLFICLIVWAIKKIPYVKKIIGFILP